MFIYFHEIPLYRLPIRGPSLAFLYGIPIHMFLRLSNHAVEGGAHLLLHQGLASIATNDTAAKSHARNTRHLQSLRDTELQALSKRR